MAPRTVRYCYPEVSYQPWQSFNPDPQVPQEMVTGVFVETFQALAGRQAWTVVLTGVPVNSSDSLNGSQEDLGNRVVALLERPDCDVVPGSPCPKACAGIQSSIPFYVSQQNVLVMKTQVPDSFWRLAEPFESSVWVGVVLTILLFACGLAVLRRVNPRTTEQAVTLRGTADALYHSTAAFLQGDEETGVWPRGPSRLIRVAMLLFVLVVNATYTANLAAFFTAPAVQLVGPTSFNSLSTATVCVPEGIAYDSIRNFVGRIIIPSKAAIRAADPTGLQPLQAAMSWCHDAVRDVSPRRG